MVEPPQVGNLMNQVPGHVFRGLHIEPVLEDCFRDIGSDIANHPEDVILKPTASVKTQMHMSDPGSQLVEDLLIVHSIGLGEDPGDDFPFKAW